MSPRSVPWRPLAVLTAAVLLAHLAALRATPGVIDLRRPADAARFITRSIPAQPAAPNAPAATAATAAGPVFEQKAPEADVPSASIATNSIAKPPPRGAAPETMPAPRRAAAPADSAGPAAAAAPLPAPAPALAAAVPAAAPAASPPDRPLQPAVLALPGSVRLRYEVEAQARGLQLRGRAELLWRHDGTRYEARLEVSVPPLPTRSQNSAGAITADGLAPTRFSDRSRSEEAVHFERDRGRISFSSNRPEAALLPGAQDRLSVLLQLAALMGGAPARYPPGTTISMQIAGTRDAELWQFTVEAEEALQLPGGPATTLRLVRQPRRDFDQKVEVWLAPGMDYAPVRLRLTHPNGDWLDQQWSATDRN